MTLLALALLQVRTQLPTAHVDRNIEGWAVHIDRRLLSGQHKPAGDQALKFLSIHLQMIENRVPVDKVKWMQTHVPIWLDFDCGKLIGPQYHPSAEWLKDNGYNVAMAKCVDIPNVPYFNRKDFEWEQPLAILHEMAHAYHDQVLGFGDKEIIAAFKSFCDSHKFDRVLRNTGRYAPHYALTNEKEFFAEMTETYFGANDFYPFNKGELQEAAPDVLKLMEKIWGPTY